MVYDDSLDKFGLRIFKLGFQQIHAGHTEKELNF